VSLFKRNRPEPPPAFPHPEGTLEFKSKVGDRPWFFVPDTGTPGGSAVLVDPVGKQTPATETQLSPPKDTLPNGEPWVARWGKRVGFRVPVEFPQAGTYWFVVTQDDVETVYEIEVR
jgi:hypothetical protein